MKTGNLRNSVTLLGTAWRAGYLELLARGYLFKKSCFRHRPVRWWVFYLTAKLKGVRELIRTVGGDCWEFYQSDKSPSNRPTVLISSLTPFSFAVR